MKKFKCLVLGLPILLSACSMQHISYDRTDPGKWGNYKCSAAGDGKTYTGWSVDKSQAWRNALSICHEKTGVRCKVKSCENGTVPA